MRITPGFLFGVVVGAVFALMFAPTRGDETRERFNERTRELRERLRRYWED